MTLTIELPDELTARLTEAGIPPDEASRYAVIALEEVAESAEVRAWWDSLAEKDQETERTRTEESLAAADAGFTRSAEDVYTRIRARRSAEPTA